MDLSVMPICPVFPNLLSILSQERACGVYLNEALPCLHTLRTEFTALRSFSQFNDNICRTSMIDSQRLCLEAAGF